jgi:predicted DCC family thiol-disulfide oxidoreductase YuxK
MRSPPGPEREQKLPGADADNLIVFDGVCILCSGFARFVARHDRKVGFKFVDAHSETGRALYHRFRLDPDLMETNIVIIDSQPYTKMASFTAAMKSLGWPWKALAVLDLLPRDLADRAYDMIARNRYRFGRRACPLPSTELKERLLD